VQFLFPNTSRRLVALYIVPKGDCSLTTTQKQNHFVGRFIKSVCARIIRFIKWMTTCFDSCILITPSRPSLGSESMCIEEGGSLFPIVEMFGVWRGQKYVGVCFQVLIPFNIFVRINQFLLRLSCIRWKSYETAVKYFHDEFYLENMSFHISPILTVPWFKAHIFRSHLGHRWLCLCCPVCVETSRWPDPLSKGFYEIWKKVIDSEVSSELEQVRGPKCKRWRRY
jgi:hypothetical protein